MPKITAKARKPKNRDIKRRERRERARLVLQQILQLHWQFAVPTTTKSDFVLKYCNSNVEIQVYGLSTKRLTICYKQVTDQAKEYAHTFRMAELDLHFPDSPIDLDQPLVHVSKTITLEEFLDELNRNF